MKRILLLLTVSILVIGLLGFTNACGDKGEAPEKEPSVTKEVKAEATGQEVDMDLQKKAEAFLDEYTAEAKKLYIEQAQAYWKASNSGKEEDFNAYAKADLELKKLHSDSQRYSTLEQLLTEKDKLKPLTARSLTVISLQFKENQLPKEELKQLTDMAAEIEQNFTVYRGTLDGKKYSNNQLEGMLKEETDSAKRQKIWEALKQVGEAVGPKLVELAKLRNQAAVKLGYKNFWDMKIRLQEHDPDNIMTIFKELETKTDEIFKKAKAQMDSELAGKFNMSPEEMMPWHYDNPFFQETPPSDKVDLDEFYKDKTKEEMVEIAKKFYDGIGLIIDDIIQRSDLYEREGKQPHAYTISIDRNGDVRVLVNVKPNAYWMDTTLHEMGHAVYDKYIDRSLPFVLRDAAHAFTTEAVAMLFGALSKNPLWITTEAGADPERVKEVEGPILEQRRREQLLFCRWTLVMLHFEKALYENPEQDLNTLWWDLVERFQMLKRPEERNKADWAAKIHFTIAPVYYHNYMLGELLAAQIRGKLVKMLNHQGPVYNLNYSGNKEIGKYFIEEIFKPGARYPWPEFVKRATGEPLTAKYFAEEVK